MNVRRPLIRAHAALWLLWIAVCTGMASAQGFAGLGSDADGFRLPAPEPVFRFPTDHGPHPDFRIEWWYVTANLSGPDGTDYGIQWTLFRSALAPGERAGWASPQIWFGHAAVTTATNHFVGERLARGGVGIAGATAAPFAAWIDDWQMAADGADAADTLDHLSLTARGADFAYDLRLSADGLVVSHGADGYSLKSPKGQASYYYSQPHYQVTGTLELPEGPVPVTGLAWLDREWSSQPLATTQTGWDWFSLHLDGGEKLMVYRLRDSAAPDHVPATYIAADGRTESIPDGQLVLTPLRHTRVAERRIPVEWRIEWPERDMDLRTIPLNPQSWMDTNFPYWEGPVRVTGSHGGKGYLEMTGHD